MANILYAAISQDGFIADLDDKTPWSSEETIAFNAFVRTCDAILLGRRSFEIMRDGQELQPGIRYIVATTKPQHLKGIETVTIETKQDIPEFPKLGVIGGGELNGRLAKLGALDELFLDIEPITLKDGVRLFGNHDIPLKLEPLESRKISSSTMQRHYKILSSQ
jgi:dihydrofolate reductase